MRMKIKLQTVIDAIEQASDAYTMLYDRNNRPQPAIVTHHRYM